MRVLVITSCTGEKLYKTEGQLIKDDFESEELFNKKVKKLSNNMVTAFRMYTGKQHINLVDGINKIRNRFGQDIIDLKIVSAGYGLIDEKKKIAPYEVTFNTMNSNEIVEWSNFLKLKEDIKKVITSYDLVLFLLGTKYIRALQLISEDYEDIIYNKKKFVFMASKTSKKHIPSTNPFYFVEVGQDDASSFGYGLVGLKGYLFKLLANEVEKHGIGLLDEIYRDPDKIINVLDKYRKDNKNDKQKSLFPKYKGKSQFNKTNKINTYINDDQQVAKNYGQPMLYYIPEWDDRVDPDYQFTTDDYHPERSRDIYEHDVYAHQIYNTPNYDGILISRETINNTKMEAIKNKGIHKFLRYSNTNPIMGDCGAFGYVKEYEPPYETLDMLKYYEDIGIDYGVSIDHLIFSEDLDERKRRFSITQNNAEEFLKLYNEDNYSFKPIGVAQGWDPNSYQNAFGNLLDMGYDYIALGGLVRTKTEDIIKILIKIVPLIKANTKVHLFGVSRVKSIETFRRLGVTSFDSASYLRKAWLSSSSNYIALNGNRYAAIRIPQTDGNSITIRKIINAEIATQQELEKLEQNSLKVLREYDSGNIDIGSTLEVVMAYEEKVQNAKKDVKVKEILESNLKEEKKADKIEKEERKTKRIIKKHRKKYYEVLSDKPWKYCDCKICNDIGIEVVIFRGNNRNRRRGFHNTYVFYKQFQDIVDCLDNVNDMNKLDTVTI